MNLADNAPQTPADLENQLRAMEQASKLHPHDWAVLRRYLSAQQERIAALERERDTVHYCAECFKQLTGLDYTAEAWKARAEQAEATLASVRALREQWRARAARVDTVHATIGIGWKACADDLDHALAGEAGEQERTE